MSRGFATAAGIAPASHARGYIGVALMLGDVDFPAPIKPGEAKLAMSCCGSNVDLFILRPSALFPVSLAVKN